jgi:dihydrofolate reductase
MTEVYTGASVSLDGYIAGPGESGLEHLFKWLGNGDVVVPTTDPELTMRMTEVNAAHWRGVVDMTGALVVGRKLFDFTNGWGGNHPMGRPVVGVNGGTIASQSLDAGLLDEIWVDLVPVLLGGGTSYFSELRRAPAELEGPISVVEGTDVTHLRYRVRYPARG